MKKKIYDFSHNTYECMITIHNLGVSFIPSRGLGQSLRCCGMVIAPPYWVCYGMLPTLVVYFFYFVAGCDGWMKWRDPDKCLG